MKKIKLFEKTVVPMPDIPDIKDLIVEAIIIAVEIAVIVFVKLSKDE